MPNNPLTVVTDGTADLAKTLKDLANTSVMVGIPSDREQGNSGSAGTEKRKEGPIGNAALGYIHETGSPINNIPPRPFLRPGVNDSRKRWEPYLQQAASLAMEGKPDAVDRALHAAGLTAVAAVKNKITAGLSPPLKQSTINARRRRSKSRLASTAADVKPLIDTGQLLNSINYVVRKKKS